MWFYRWKHGISWTEYVIDEEVLMKIQAARFLIHATRKKAGVISGKRTNEERMPIKYNTHKTLKTGEAKVDCE